MHVSSKFYTENKYDWYSVVLRYFVVPIPVYYYWSKKEVAQQGVQQEVTQQEVPLKEQQKNNSFERL